jgi:hypothetical protein
MFLAGCSIRKTRMKCNFQAQKRPLQEQSGTALEKKAIILRHYWSEALEVGLGSVHFLESDVRPFSIEGRLCGDEEMALWADVTSSEAAFALHFCYLGLPSDEV